MSVSRHFVLGVNVDKTFIIIEPDPVVCMDVEGMLIAEYPKSQLSVGASLADVAPMTYSCGANCTLFVRGSLISESDDLGRAVRIAATRGCRIVIIGLEEDFDFPATFIDLPFTTDMVMAAVGQAASERPINAPD